MKLRLAAALFAIGALVVPSSASAKPLKVELLKSGKGAKKKLRLTPKKGQTSILEMAMGMKMSMEMGGMKMPPTEAPTTILTMKTKVEDTKPDGTFVYAFTFTDVKLDASSGMPPAAVEQMRAATKELVGITGRGTMTATGQNLGAKFDLPPTMSPGARQTLEGMRGSIEQIAAPFPTQAVGVGASWRVKFTTEQMGISVAQETLYTLESMKGSRIDLRAKVKQSAASASATMPNLPPGTEARLVGLDSKGDATMTLDLGHVLPVAGVTNVDMDMTAELTAQGQTSTMKMGMDMSVKLTAR